MKPAAIAFSVIALFFIFIEWALGTQAYPWCPFAAC